MSNFYRNLHPAGRLGLWGLPVLIVVTVLLFQQIREEQSPERLDVEDLTTLSADKGRHVVRLGSMPPSQALTDQYVPLPEATRARVLRRLDALSANYRAVALTIRIESLAEDTGLIYVTRTLTEMLAIYRMTASGEERNPAAQNDGPITLYCPQGEMPIAYASLSAIAPFIHANVVIVEQPGRPAGQMLLRISEAPRFTRDGRAVF